MLKILSDFDIDKYHPMTARIPDEISKIIKIWFGFIAYKS